MFFQDAPIPPWQLFVGDGRNRAVKAVGGAASTWDRDNLVVTPVDRNRQGDARAARWAGYELASVYLEAVRAIDLSAAAADCGVLAFDVALEEPPSAPVQVAMRCGDRCQGSVEITAELVGRPAGEWLTISVPLRRFGTAGTDLSHVTAPFVLETEGTLALRFASIRLEPRTGGPPCE